MNNCEPIAQKQGQTQACSSRGASAQDLVGTISLLAVTGFVFSLVSFFLCAGVIAICLGIISLVRIHRSGNVIKGRGLALAAVLLPVLMVVVLALVSEVNRTRAVTSETRCATNLSRLGKAMMAYTAEHNRLPTSGWCDAIMSIGSVDADTLHCPGASETGWQFIYPLEVYLYLGHKSANRSRARCDYAMNRDAELTSAHPDTVLLYDARPGWNKIGGPSTLNADNHKGKGCNVLFMDGHVEFISFEDFGQLDWDGTKDTPR